MRPGYVNGPELLADCLAEFQAMYDGFNAVRTSGFTIPDYIYPIGSSTGLNGIYGQNVQFTVGPVFTIAATLTSGSNVAAVLNTAGLIIGQPITGSGVPANTYITAVSINTSITLSQNATSTGPQTLTLTPTFVGPRPEAILRMNLYMTSASPTQPTRIPLTPLQAEEWANISVIQITAVNVTTVFYYDPQFPQGVINVWPPLNGNSLEFFTWGFLTPPTSLTATYTAPPGYDDWLVFTLATRIYGLCTNDVAVNKADIKWLRGKAANAKEAVRRVNAPHPKMINDFGGGNRQNTAVCDWGLLLTGVPY